MDSDYLLHKIDQFIEQADGERGRPDDLRVLADQLTIIAAKVRPDLAQRGFDASPNGKYGYSWNFARQRAVVLRQHIIERDDLFAALGPTGPKLAANRFHPWVWAAAATHWDAGHHDVAVREAARAVLVHLREKAGYPDIDGLPLVNALFSDKDPTPDRPRLRTWRPAGATDETADNVQQGVGSLGRACVRLIRNVTQHDDGVLDDVEALEMLATLSLFARHAESCRVETASTDGGGTSDV